MIGENYHISDTLIGDGTFGKVYLGKNIFGENIAVKIIPKNHTQVETEIKIMKKINHPNIIRLYHFVKNSKEVILYMEYCNRGTLMDVIKYHQENYLSPKDREENCVFYLSQLMKGLVYLYRSGYLHGDIKPTNVLLQGASESYHHTGKLNVKIIDFGLSQKWTLKEMKYVGGTVLYSAPELLLDEIYKISSDLWSYGVIMYQMLFGRLPIVGDTTEMIKKNMLTANIKYEGEYSPECYQLLEGLLTKNCEKRIDWKGFEISKWFQKRSAYQKNIEPVKSDSSSNLTKMSVPIYIPQKWKRMSYRDFASSYPPQMEHEKIPEKMSSSEKDGYFLFSFMKSPS